MLYPQQNASRLTLSLDGVWDFCLGEAADPAAPLPNPDRVAVPASYNDQKPDPAWRDHYGWASYQRLITLPRACAGQRAVLRFGSVTHKARVWVDGACIAEHTGGFLPFEVDLTGRLAPAKRPALPLKPTTGSTTARCRLATNPARSPSSVRTMPAFPRSSMQRPPPRRRTAPTLISSTTPASIGRSPSTQPPSPMWRISPLSPALTARLRMPSPPPALPAKPTYASRCSMPRAGRWHRRPARRAA